MKMPNARQISEEQQDIFEDAPIDGSILVSGPPGTGKTVIAFLRAQLLAKKQLDVTVLMFNRVLRKYTENVASQIEGNVMSRTMHQWFPEWWRLHSIPQVDNVDSTSLVFQNSRAYLNCPFEEKDELKKLGGKWDRYKQKWHVSQDSFQQNPENYSKWSGASIDPIEIEKWKYDWLAMQDKYLDLDSEDCHDWGHLIIDEAQDFESNMYKFLRFSSQSLTHGGVTILADENQRLEESDNSSLEEIRKALKIKPNREFKLTENYRNTKQIAEVARRFYVGLETGMPEIPSRSGDKPQLVAAGSTDLQIKYIHNYLQYRGALEVGLIVENERDRGYFVEQLQKQLLNYKVQSYTSSDYQSSEDLAFDVQGVVTILNRKSCKGLEFDVVFIPQLQNYAAEDSDLTTLKMNLYVMCSRAKEGLIFLMTGNTLENSSLATFFPDKESGLIEYREQK